MDGLYGTAGPDVAHAATLPPGEALCGLGVGALLDGYRAGRFTPHAVVAAYLARIARLNPRLHSYLLVFGDELGAQAQAALARYRDGSARPLEGVPVGIKDLIDIAGHPTTAGSAMRRGAAARKTATLVTRLVAAGALILGKQHTAEYAFGSWGDNEHMGAPWNPWRLDQHLVPGASSSGGAVAVAAALAPVAIGTDTGGSVRVPAAFNGIVGFKPSSGRISGQGIVPLSPTLDSPGVLARSVEDAARVYDVLQGHDDLDPRTWYLPADAGLHEALRLAACGGLQGMRLASLCARDRQGVDAEVLAAYDHCLDLLAGAGALVEPLALPRPLAAYGDPAPMAAESFALYGDQAADPSVSMDRRVRERILGGDISAREFLQGRQHAIEETVEFHQRLQGFQAFLTPTTLVPAIALEDIDAHRNATVLTRFVNMFGLCGVALPSGYNGGGLPVSLQVVCRRFDEQTAMVLAAALERLTAGERHYPVL